jgi:hypothetical protein
MEIRFSLVTLGHQLNKAERRRFSCHETHRFIFIEYLSRLCNVTENRLLLLSIIHSFTWIFMFIYRFHQRAVYNNESFNLRFKLHFHIQD